MGIFDKAREALTEHTDRIDPLVDRPADEADQRTDGQHGSTVDRAADPAKDKRGDQARQASGPGSGDPA